MRKYVPLSQRSPDAIRAQAELYQEMATTARMPEAKHGLEKLVARLTALADRREATETRPRSQPPAQGMSSTAD
jgi:hypothetical protein